MDEIRDAVRALRRTVRSRGYGMRLPNYGAVAKHCYRVRDMLTRETPPGFIPGWTLGANYRDTPAAARLGDLLERLQHPGPFFFYSMPALADELLGRVVVALRAARDGRR